MTFFLDFPLHLLRTLAFSALMTFAMSARSPRGRQELWGDAVHGLPDIYVG